MDTKQAVEMIKDLDASIRLKVAKTLVAGKNTGLPPALAQAVVMAMLDVTVPRIIATLAANTSDPTKITEVAFEMLEKSIRGMREQMPEVIADTLAAMAMPEVMAVNAAFIAEHSAKPEPDLQPGAPNPNSPWAV